MSFDSVIVAAVTRELKKELTGGGLDTVHQPAPLDVVLGIRNHGANHRLLISVQAQSARMHLTATRRGNPKTPPQFCMLLRKHLRGAKLSTAEQIDFDRIVHLVFDAYDGERLRLIVEIMGKHSNVILVNGTGRILGAIKPIGKSKNRYREILPGREYVPPPNQGKLNPLDTTADSLRVVLSRSSLANSDAGSEQVSAWLSGTFTGISPFAAREISSLSGGDLQALPDAFEGFFGRLRSGDLSPVLLADDTGQAEGFYPLPLVTRPAANQHRRSSVSLAADTYYASVLPRMGFEQAKNEFLQRVKAEMEAKHEALQEIQRGLARSENADRLKQLGELILSQLNDVGQGDDKAVLTDYYAPSGGQVVVQLYPQLSPTENAESYFRKYQKAISGKTALQDRLAEVRAEIKLLQKISTSAASVLNEEQIRSLTEVLESNGIRIRKQEAAAAVERRSEFAGHRISKVLSNDWEILVGENSEANDYLLTQVSRPNDYWVHVKASPSAHVIVRTNGKPESVPPSVLHAAAELAVRHSSSKHSSLVPVDYTLRKYVRKPKGAPAGKAIYQNEKTIYVTPNA